MVVILASSYQGTHISLVVSDMTVYAKAAVFKPAPGYLFA